MVILCIFIYILHLMSYNSTNSFRYSHRAVEISHTHTHTQSNPYLFFSIINFCFDHMKKFKILYFPCEIKFLWPVLHFNHSTKKLFPSHIAPKRVLLQQSPSKNCPIRRKVAHYLGHRRTTAASFFSFFPLSSTL